LDHNFESTAEALIQEASKMGFQNLGCKLGEVTDPYSMFFQVKNYLYINIEYL